MPKGGSASVPGVDLSTTRLGIEQEVNKAPF
jgi:hypothetical protein